MIELMADRTKKSVLLGHGNRPSSSREESIPLPIHRTHLQHGLGSRIEQYRDTPRTFFSLPPSNRHWLICQNYAGPQRLRVQAGNQEKHVDALSEQQVIYIPPGTPTDWEFSSAKGSTHLLIPDQVFLQALPDSHFLSVIQEEGPQVGVKMPHLSQFINSYSNRLSQTAAVSDLALSDLILETTTAFAQELVTQNGGRATSRQKSRSLDRGKLQILREFMWDNLQENITLSDLAELVHLSPYHFSRVFKSETRVSPYQALLRFRVYKARTLIPTRLSLTEIAYACGFSDQAHFTRVFKAHTSFTPSQFRKVSA